MPKEKKSKNNKIKKKSANDTEPDVINFTAREVVADLADEMAERGFHPCAMGFKNEDGVVEIFTHGIDVETFVKHLNEQWLPEALKRRGERGAGRMVQ